MAGSEIKTDFSTIREPLKSFNAYDFFGYLLPSSFTLILVLLFDYFYKLEICKNLLRKSETQFFLWGTTFFKGKNTETFLDIFFKMNVTGWNAVFIALITVIFLYIFGHFIATLSGILIDKMIIGRTLGYPYLYHLSIRKQKESKSTYRIYKELLRQEKGYIEFSALLSYINVALILLMAIPLKYFYEDNKFSILSKCIFCIMILIVLEIFIYFTFRNMTKKNCINWLFNKALYYINFFFSWPTILLVIGFQLFNINKKFPPDLAEKCLQKFEEKILNGKIGLESKTDFTNPEKREYFLNKYNTEIYWLTYAYLQSVKSGCIPLVTHFVNLYGFLRNLIISILLVPVIMFFLFYFGDYYSSRYIRIISIICYLLAFLFFIRYIYLFSNYYTRLIFRSLLLEDSNNQIDDSRLN